MEELLNMFQQQLLELEGIQSHLDNLRLQIVHALSSLSSLQSNGALPPLTGLQLAPGSYELVDPNAYQWLRLRRGTRGSGSGSHSSHHSKASPAALSESSTPKQPSESGSGSPSGSTSTSTSHSTIIAAPALRLTMGVDAGSKAKFTPQTAALIHTSRTAIAQLKESLAQMREISSSGISSAVSPQGHSETSKEGTLTSHEAVHEDVQDAPPLISPAGQQGDAQEMIQRPSSSEQVFEENGGPGSGADSAISPSQVPSASGSSGAPLSSPSSQPEAELASESTEVDMARTYQAQLQKIEDPSEAGDEAELPASSEMLSLHSQSVSRTEDGGKTPQEIASPNVKGHSVKEVGEGRLLQTGSSGENDATLPPEHTHSLTETASSSTSSEAFSPQQTQRFIPADHLPSSLASNRTPPVTSVASKSTSSMPSTTIAPGPSGDVSKQITLGLNVHVATKGKVVAGPASLPLMQAQPLLSAPGSIISPPQKAALANLTNNLPRGMQRTPVKPERSDSSRSRSSSRDSSQGSMDTTDSSPLHAHSLSNNQGKSDTANLNQALTLVAKGALNANMLPKSNGTGPSIISSLELNELLNELELANNAPGRILMGNGPPVNGQHNHLAHESNEQVAPKPPLVVNGTYGAQAAAPLINKPRPNTAGPSTAVPQPQMQQLGNARKMPVTATSTKPSTAPSDRAPKLNPVPVSVNGQNGLAIASSTSASAPNVNVAPNVPLSAPSLQTLNKNGSNTHAQPAQTRAQPTSIAPAPSAPSKRLENNATSISQALQHSSVTTTTSHNGQNGNTATLSKAAAPSTQGPVKAPLSQGEAQTLHGANSGRGRDREARRLVTLRVRLDRAGLGSLIRGYLTRRLYTSERVRQIAKTIRDTAQVALNLTEPSVSALRGRPKPTSQELELQKRVFAQLRSSLLDFYQIFFEADVADQMAIIAHSRTLRFERSWRERAKSMSPGAYPLEEVDLLPEATLPPTLALAGAFDQDDPSFAFSARSEASEASEGGASARSRPPRLSMATIRRLERRREAQQQQLIQMPVQAIPGPPLNVNGNANGNGVPIGLDHTATSNVRNTSPRSARELQQDGQVQRSLQSQPSRRSREPPAAHAGLAHVAPPFRQVNGAISAR